MNIKLYKSYKNIFYMVNEIPQNEEAYKAFQKDYLPELNYQQKKDEQNLTKVENTFYQHDVLDQIKNFHKRR